MTAPEWVVVGGSGFVGSAVCRHLLAGGAAVSAVDPARPAEDLLDRGLRWQPADPAGEPARLPPGEVVLALGASVPAPRRRWTLAADNALATARLLADLRGRRVTLVSSAEVYGWAPAPLRESTPPRLPAAWSALEDWAGRAVGYATSSAPSGEDYRLCRELEAMDPSGRWVYALSKAAQEVMLASALPDGELVVLRAANLFGCGQERVVAAFVRAVLAGRDLAVTAATTRTFAPVGELAAAVAARPPAGTYNLGSTVLGLDSLAERVMAAAGRRVRVRPAPRPEPDSCGVLDASRLGALVPPHPFEPALAALVGQLAEGDQPLFDPPLPVVVPPRPERPDLLARRQHQALSSGQLAAGNRWGRALAERLADVLGVGGQRRVLVTGSGTAALRLALWATAGPAEPGQVAVLPSFSFPATAEVLVQLGYRLAFCDVDPASWTLDPAAVGEVLATTPQARVVVPVDALGNPADYRALEAVCRAHGVAMVADSAASLGARVRGEPVAVQAEAHAFSMSFAKVVSAGGAGGVVVVAPDATLDGAANWLRSSQLSELHAVAALDQLECVEELVRRRHEVAATYAAAAGAAGLRAQRVAPGDRHSYVHYGLAFPGGRACQAAADRLDRLGVQTRRYYTPLHRMAALGPWRYGEQPLPVTEELGASVLALPMSSELTPAEAERVAFALELAVRRGRPATAGVLSRPAHGPAQPAGLPRTVTRSLKRGTPKAASGPQRDS